MKTRISPVRILVNRGLRVIACKTQVLPLPVHQALGLVAFRLIDTRVRGLAELVLRDRYTMNLEHFSYNCGACLVQTPRRSHSTPGHGLWSHILVAWILMLVLLAPTAVQAQYQYLTNNGTITITRYTGSASNVAVIPRATHGLPVTKIKNAAFANCTRLTGVTIPTASPALGSGRFLFVA